MVSIVRQVRLLVQRWLHSLSGVGIVLGTLFFAAALTPTLVPRTALIKVAGGCFAIGYGFGIFGRWLWHYLELPESRGRVRVLTNGVLAIISIAVVATYLWRAAEWQNSIRAVMKMAPVETARPLTICAIALDHVRRAADAGAAVRGCSPASWPARTQRYVPRKIAIVIGVTDRGLCSSGRSPTSILISTALPTRSTPLSANYAMFYAPERPQPTDAGTDGKRASSLVKWRKLEHVRAAASLPQARPRPAIGAFVGGPGHASRCAFMWG